MQRKTTVAPESSLKYLKSLKEKWGRLLMNMLSSVKGASITISEIIVLSIVDISIHEQNDKAFYGESLMLVLSLYFMYQ